MVHGRQGGNTLAEYGVLFGLVIVVCMAGISVLGNALLNLNTTVSAHIGSTLPFDTPVAQQQKSTWMTPGSAGGSSQPVTASKAWNFHLGKFNWSLQGMDGTGTETFQAPATNAKGGNITGNDGDAASTPDLYAQTVLAALKMHDMSVMAVDPSLKEWLEEAAVNTMRLAKNQAALKYNQDTDMKSNQALVAFVGQADISQAVALNSMENWQGALQGLVYRVQSDSSLENKAMAQVGTALISNVLQSQTLQYGSLLNGSNLNAAVYTPNTDHIKQDAKQAINAGIVSDSPAIQASLNGSVTLKTVADSTP
jgi:Flp pilus assembly pilin Flp